MARHAGHSKPGSKPVQIYVRLSFKPVGQPSGLRWLREFFKGIYLATAAAAFVYIFHTLSATRLLNSYEELCITLGAADNSFARVLNPHGGAYVYCHPQTDCFILSELFSVARHAGHSKPGSKPDLSFKCIFHHPQTVLFYQNSSVWLDRLDS